LGCQHEQIRALELENEALRRREQVLARELEDLQQVATQLIAADGVQELYAQILSTALAILRADFATIQLYEPNRGNGELRLLDHRGLSEAAAIQWEWVRSSATTICGEALRTGKRVAVPDIRDCNLMLGSDNLRGYTELGIVGAQATPLYSRSGSLLGMVSTYWREPHELFDSELRALDVLARLAADLIERSSSEEKLRESEARLRFAQETAGIGTFDWDIDTGLNTWTTELEAIHGLPSGGFAGTQADWESFVHPDDRTRMVQLVAESLKTGHSSEAEWRIVRTDGSVRWICGRWRVVKDQSDKPVRLTGINIDVTDRKYMEESLRQNEERLRLAIKATNDAIWDVDLKAETVSWNDTYSAVYGRPDHADSCQWWMDRIHPEDRDRVVADFWSAVSGSASSWATEYRFRRLDGEWAYIHDRAYIARDASGRAWRIIGAMQDLTERKQAEAALRETEARFRKMADAAPVMIWLAGPDKLRTFFNRGWLEFRRRPMELELGDGWAEGIHPHDHDRCYAIYSSSFEERRAFQVEYRLLRADGEYRCILDSGVPMFTAAGVFEGYIGSCMDITELKRAQEENFDRQKLESIGVLAAGIAHDFNNLLGGILAQVQLIEDETPSGSPLVNDLHKITGLGVRASEIVRELMVYAGRETNDFETVNLSVLVGEMLELIKISLAKRAILKTSLAHNLPPIKAQASQICQVVMNLVTNASEAFMGNEGLISVTTAFEPAEGGFVRLEVSDTGCGMTEEQQRNIFDPFFTTKFAGRGLGLAVVQGVVRAHGGSITLESAPARGTTFRILLPVAAERPERSGVTLVSGHTGPVPAAGHAVLFVEDEETLRAAVAKMLRKRSFFVLEAADGDGAIELLRDKEHRIDVVLLDLTIPGVDSYKVLAEAIRVRPEIRVVLTSAYSQDASSRFTNIPQVAGYIRKPFLANELANMLAKAAAAT